VSHQTEQVRFERQAHPGSARVERVGTRRAPVVPGCARRDHEESARLLAPGLVPGTEPAGVLPRRRADEHALRGQCRKAISENELVASNRETWRAFSSIQQAMASECSRR